MLFPNISLEVGGSGGSKNQISLFERSPKYAQDVKNRMKNNFPILSYDFLKITIFQAQILDVHYLDSRRLLSR